MKLALLGLIALCGAGEVTSPAPGSKLRKELLETWRTALRKDLRGRKILFQVRTLKVDGKWAFADVEILDSNGRRMDWNATAYEQQVADGFMDQCSQCLFFKKGNHWSVKTMAIGPTDVAWLDWPEKFGAPKSIFPFPKGNF